MSHTRTSCMRPEAEVEPRFPEPPFAAVVSWFFAGNARGAVLFGILSLLVFLAGSNVPPAVVNAEARCVEINQTMYETGDLLIPRLGGEMHLTKPPLFHWLAYAVRRLGAGSALVAVRVVSGGAAAVAVVLTYLLALQLYDLRTAWWSGGLLLTSLGFLNHGHRGTFDSLLTAFVCLTLLGYVIKYYRGKEQGTTLILLGLIGGFWTKGFMGWLAPLFPITADWLFRTRGKRRPWGRILGLGAVVLVVSLVWYFYLLRYVPAARKILLDVVTVNFGSRHTGARMAFHQAPFWYYLVGAPEVFLPWSLLLLPLVLRYRRSWRACWSDSNRLVFLWLVMNLLFLSFIPAKAGRYLVPVIPAFALLAGRLVVHAAEEQGLGERFWRRWFSGVLILFGVAGVTALPLWLWVRPGEPVAVCLLAGALLTGGVVLAMRWQLRERPAAALAALTILLVLLTIPAYAAWIPRHNLLRRYRHLHGKSPERAAYEARKSRLERWFRPGPAAADKK